MRKVIIIGEEPKEESALNPVEFTYCLHDAKGWTPAIRPPNDYRKIVYLGKCVFDGDVFAAYNDGKVLIYKGHLNDGVY